MYIYIQCEFQYEIYVGASMLVQLCLRTVGPVRPFRSVHNEKSVRFLSLS